jgi:hypothetical protein
MQEGGQVLAEQDERQGLTSSSAAGAGSSLYTVSGAKLVSRRQTQRRPGNR